MSRFIFHSIVYILLTIVLAWTLCLFGGPYTDPFYLRFTTPRQQSLVIGSSKAAHGIVPDVINKSFLDNQLPVNLYNYGFTVKSSSFGEPYLASVLKKIDKSKPIDKNNRIFILAVDPWSISTMSLVTKNDKTEFKDKDFPPNNINFTSVNPNPEYIFKNVDNRLLMMFRKFRHPNHPRVHEDGSFEVPQKRDSAETQVAIKGKIAEYLEYKELYRYSDLRYDYLGITIDSLQKYGNVFLVRIPVHPRMRALENEFMSDFNDRMKLVSKNHNVPFFDYDPTDKVFVSTDGNHLVRESAINFSKILAEDILKELKGKQ